MSEFQDCSLLLRNLDRIEALRSTGLYGTAPEEAFTRLNRLATKLLKAPISIFSLIGEKSQFFKSAEGFDIKPDNNEVPIDVSVCMYSLQGKPLKIEDTLGHPLFSENPAVKALNIVGYLGIPVVTKDGHPIGAVCVIDHKKRNWSDEEISILEEITSSFLSEIELRRAMNQIERESRLREEFISMASHELQNPLSVMKMQSQLLRLKASKQTLTAEDQLSSLKSIERQIQRLNIMIDDMTDISRLERGEFSLHCSTADLSALAKEVYQNYEGQLNAAGISARVEIENGIHGFLDATRIEQVMDNLISNVVKYAPGSEVQLTLTKSSDGINFTLSDTGPGMSPEDQTKIFEKFERVRSNENVKGLGLGLFIARQIVEQHGGTLIVKSILGEGSVFKLSLPLPSIM